MKEMLIINLIIFSTPKSAPHGIIDGDRGPEYSDYDYRDYDVYDQYHDNEGQKLVEDNKNESMLPLAVRRILKCLRLCNLFKLLSVRISSTSQASGCKSDSIPISPATSPYHRRARYWTTLARCITKP